MGIAAVLAVAAVLVMGLFGGGPVAGLGGGVPVKGSVEEYSWAELSQISQEIGKAGITFIFQDAVGHHSMYDVGTNSGGWEASEMRSWLNSDLKEQLPSDLQDVIVPVSKMTNNVGKTQSASSVTATSDVLWLFSSRELCGQIDWYSYSDSYCKDVLNAEGVQYKLFRDMNVDSDNGNAILAKTSWRGRDAWWERSARPSHSDRFLRVSPDGNPAHFVSPDAIGSVVPGFCIWQFRNRRPHVLRDMGAALSLELMALPRGKPVSHGEMVSSACITIVYIRIALCGTMQMSKGNAWRLTR